MLVTVYALDNFEAIFGNLINYTAIHLDTNKTNCEKIILNKKCIFISTFQNYIYCNILL